MMSVLQPWHLLLAILAGWINREQQRALEFQRSEIEVLLELLGKRRLVLNDDQRLRLAVKGKALGRKALLELATIVTPDSILRWHRKLVAAKWDYSQTRPRLPCRPPVAAEIAELVLRMAKDNPTWGYNRIQGALANLGHKVSDAAVGNILKAHGIEPAPQRKRGTSWKTFLDSHRDVLAAIDFTALEIWTATGLRTIYLLFVMHVGSRRVHFAGSTANPDERWMTQIARNLIDTFDGFLNSKRHLIMDRDTKFSDHFRGMLKQAGVKPLRLPARSPNLNAHLERLFRSAKSECLERRIFFSEESVCRAVNEYLVHYHTERNHQGLNNRLIEAANAGPPEGRRSLPRPHRRICEVLPPRRGVNAGHSSGCPMLIPSRHGNGAPRSRKDAAPTVQLPGCALGSSPKNNADQFFGAAGRPIFDFG